MADAYHVAPIDNLGFLDRRRAGEPRGARRMGFELPGAHAADRARVALRAVHAARRADFPWILFTYCGIYVAELVALTGAAPREACGTRVRALLGARLIKEGEAGRWNFT